MEVDEGNKRIFLTLCARRRMVERVAAAVEAFKEGFHALVPEDYLAILDAGELELMLSGLPTIDTDDLEANTVYMGAGGGVPVVAWFWGWCRGLDEEDRARLLQFVTGSARVPLGGFANLNPAFTIETIARRDGLPRSHTCFNRLDLPAYASRQDLERFCTFAIQEGDGFGFQ